MPLGDALRVDKGKMMVGVPFLTAMKDMVLDDVELKIILPEGARSVAHAISLKLADGRRDVEVITPFSVDSVKHSIHKTFLDSTGRPTVTLRKTRCTENHAQAVYVCVAIIL